MNLSSQATWEAEISRTDHSSRSAWAKMFVILHLNKKKLVLVVRACHLSDSGKHKIERLLSRLATAKRAGCVLQMIEHLPKKSKALSSNPSTVCYFFFFLIIILSVVCCSLVPVGFPRPFYRACKLKLFSW
jgi:hypothetical protein